MVLAMCALPRWPSGKAPASRTRGMWFESHFPCGCHTSDLKISTLMAMLSGARIYRISTRTGWPFVSMLLLGRSAVSTSVWQHVNLFTQGAMHGVTVSASAFLACHQC